MKSVFKKIMIIITIASAVNPAFVSAGWRDWFTTSATSALATLQENKKVAVGSLAALVVAGCSARALSARALYRQSAQPLVAPDGAPELELIESAEDNAAVRLSGEGDHSESKRREKPVAVENRGQSAVGDVVSEVGPRAELIIAEPVAVDEKNNGKPELENAAEPAPRIEQAVGPVADDAIDPDMPDLIYASEEFLRMREFQERNAELELENLELHKAGQDKKVFNIVADLLEHEKKTSAALRKELSQLLAQLEQRDKDFTAEKSRLAREYDLRLREMAEEYDKGRREYKSIVEQEMGYDTLESLREALSDAREIIRHRERTIQQHEKTIKGLTLYKVMHEKKQNYKHQVNRGLMGMGQSTDSLPDDFQNPDSDSD